MPKIKSATGNKENRSGTVLEGTSNNKTKSKKLEAAHKISMVTLASEQIKQQLDSRAMEGKKMKVSPETPLSSTKMATPPLLIPTVADGYNLNKRILADVYVKDLSHHIFMVWLDGLYGRKEVDIREIRTAVDPLIRPGKKCLLTEEDIFVMAIKTKTRFQPVGSCFVMLPKDIVGEDETVILHTITKHRARMILVDQAMLRKHMKLKHIMIFSDGFRDIVKTIHPQFLRALKPLGQQEDARTSPQPRALPTPSPSSAKALTAPTPAPAIATPAPAAVVAATVATKVQQPAKVKPKTKEKSAPKSKPAAQQKKSEVVKIPEAIENQPGTSNGNKVPQDSDKSRDADSTQADESDSDCQIIDGSQEPPQLVIDESESSPTGREFIPVTSESLYNAMTLMNQFDAQKRAVAIVFDSCFFLDTINMDIIRSKFKDIFGHITENQVLVRINMPKLPLDLDEAEKIGVKSLNQAYIVAQEGLTEADINRKAGARGVFCCPMTVGCVVNNLKRGAFLMHRQVLENQAPGLTPPLKRPTIDQSESSSSSTNNNSNNILELNASNHSNNSSRNSTSGTSSSKRNRLAATLGKDVATPARPGTGKDAPVEGSPPAAASMSAELKTASEVEASFLVQLAGQGDTVIRIDNLPAKLSVMALNLMMGTYSLKSQQVVAALKRGSRGNDLMDLGIVLNKDNEDVKRLLSKNGCKTCHNEKLVIALSDHKKLSKFVESRAGSLRKLDSNINLPVNKIGYSTDESPT